VRLILVLSVRFPLIFLNVPPLTPSFELFLIVGVKGLCVAPYFNPHHHDQLVLRHPDTYPPPTHHHHNVDGTKQPSPQ
jgi:hypothetical protein